MPRTVLGRAVLALGLALLPSAAVATAAPDLEVAVSVSGAVTDVGSGDPVADVCVSTRELFIGAGWEQRVCSEADGTFAFQIQPGRYEVQYDPTDDAHGMQWWPQADSPVDADVLVVRRGTPVTGIDAVLEAGATLTGRAIEGATGEPMEDACLFVSSAGVEDSIAYDFNPVGSRWTFSGLPGGEVTVVVKRCDNWHRLTWAYDALTIEEAATFDLTPGETTDIGRLELLEGATLSGTVTARRSGLRLEHIVVADSQNIRSGEPTAFRAWTDEDGMFVIDDVQPGTWLPVAYDDSPTYEPFRLQWGFGWRDGARDPRNAEPTVLEPGGSEIVNYQLDRAAKIVGTFEDLDQFIGVDVLVRPFDDDPEGQIVGLSWGYSPESGKFVIHGLPATKVLLKFDDYDQLVFWHDGVWDVDDATLVRLRPGKTARLEAHRPG